MVAGPFMPLPPGRFSISTGWPRTPAAICAILRRCRSVPPPAGQGQIRVMGLDGKDCASAPVAASSIQTPISLFIQLLPIGAPIIATPSPLEYGLPSMLDPKRSDLAAAVVGAGTMGRGIAQVLAQCGARTQLYDAQPGAAQKAKDAIA